MTSKTEFSFNVSIGADLLRELVLPTVNLTKRQDAIFYWRDDGVSVGIVDGSSVIKIRQKIRAEDFANYEVNAPHDVVSLGVPCKKIADFIDAADVDSEQVIDIEYDSPTNSLDISVPNVEYNLGGRDRDGLRTFNDPNIDFESEFHMHSEVLKRAHDIVGMVSDGIIFRIGNGEATIYGTGDTNKAIITPDCETSEDDFDSMDPEDDIVFSETFPPQESTYGKDVLGAILPYLPDSYLKVSFKGGYPLRIEAQRLGGKLSTEIIVAKRVSPES